MTSRWRRLQKINIKDFDLICQLCTSAATLHNICNDFFGNNDDHDHANHDHDEEEDPEDHDEEPQDFNQIVDGHAKRNQLMNNL